MAAVEPSIERIAELQQLIANFSKVQRVLKLPNTNRLENDVEHSYGLALTCWLLAPKVAPKLNLEKILLYAISHDIVELYSGDTYVFDTERVRTKEQRESAALERLAQEWPDFVELIDAAKGYKEKRDAEAKFVYTIDKLLPPLLINLGEKEGFWVKNKVTREMHELEKKQKMQHSPEALPYLEALNEWLRKPDYFYKPDK
jgi:putative hydrolase of HD superfamily